MIIFIADMHFGRRDQVTERAEEQDLIACIRAHQPDLERLVLLGDVYDEYIEYRHLVPKGLARLHGLLAHLTDNGMPVTYLKGNHDPWHLDYFSQELGVDVQDGPLHEPLYGYDVYMHHGDLTGSRIPFYRQLKRLVRHPLPVRMYRSLLPGDAGFGLARWVNRRLHTEKINVPAVEALRNHARFMLTQHQADLVVFAHSHYPERTTWPEGCYMNTGSWRFNRTFIQLDGDGPVLRQWTGSESIVWKRSAHNEADTPKKLPATLL